MTIYDPKAYDKSMFVEGVFQQTWSKLISLRMLFNNYDDMWWLLNLLVGGCVDYVMDLLVSLFNPTLESNYL